ncbi:tripartite tricarboxylate transporter TctB family protein [Cohaesibacter haloalkalitolerans]|uniref:tripartite tricarboxylate transporter TctB family protein n=1 Tax=Cohaesibacter haloalkalitolerans TaxID=1162980 RepID=UPI000E646FCE|nr:tripartite tricarboxylate transporter TctB family protein [Cohaesibacter haloalkalitolerans]
MKVHDSIVGLVVAILGGAIALYSQSLVPPRHLNYGPGFFPLLIGIGLLLVGGGLMVQGYVTGRGQPLVQRPRWLASRDFTFRFWIIPIAILFYWLAVTPLGFLATSTILLAMIQIANGVRWKLAVTVALITSVVVNILFASILHVPLSWGLLTPISGWFIW